MPDLSYLLEACNTDRQRRIVELRNDGKTGPEIAEILGMVHRTGPDTALRRLKKRAARLGLAPGHFEHGTAPGYRMGKVTVQRNADGSVERTWERQHPGLDDAAEIIEAAIERLPIEPLPPVPIGRDADDDLLTVIPLGDPHFGLLTWEKETGANFNLEIAEETTIHINRPCSHWRCRHGFAMSRACRLIRRPRPSGISSSVRY